MELHQLQELLKSSEKAVSEIKNQNRIFETTLQEAVKGAPIEEKDNIDQMRIFSLKIIELAKQGKSEEAQQLIKEFKNGGQSNK